MIKRFLIILVLIFNLPNLSIADDISDFQIEGMSIGDSLLDYFSKEEINANIEKYYDSDKYTIQPKYKKNPVLKHYMYAGQWFLFAIIGLVFMLILLRREK